MSKFQSIKDTHLALTQYYRWYQVYEVPVNDARINNQLDILDSGVEITSAQLGTTKGTDGIGDRLRMFEGWKNAHHVQNTSVTRVSDEELALEADILYQNIRPDDSRYSYTIRYSTKLKTRENDLPQFTSVNIQPTGNIENPGFEEAYADNRAKSFMHYWLYLMETAQVNSDKFQELLADGFELNLSTSSPLTTWDAFKTWITTSSARVKDSAHYPKNFVAKQQEDGTIKVAVDFEWEGISAAGEDMVAETHHEWVLANNLDERFARMKTMQVTQTKPFQVVK